MSSGLSRREALRAMGMIVLGAGCKRSSSMPASCSDTGSLSPEAAQVRSSLAYVDASETPGKDCYRCLQFIAAPDEGKCGACKLLQGPVHPNGYCKAFAARA